MSVTSLQYFHLTVHVIKAWPLQGSTLGLAAASPVIQDPSPGFRDGSLPQLPPSLSCRQCLLWGMAASAICPPAGTPFLSNTWHSSFIHPCHLCITASALCKYSGHESVKGKQCQNLGPSRQHPWCWWIGEHAPGEGHSTKSLWFWSQQLGKGDFLLERGKIPHRELWLDWQWEFGIIWRVMLYRDFRVALFLRFSWLWG